VSRIKEKIATVGRHLDALKILALTAANEFSMRATECVRPIRASVFAVRRYTYMWMYYVSQKRTSVDAWVEGGSVSTCP